jgi:hypothetical protein
MKTEIFLILENFEILWKLWILFLIFFLNFEL